MAALRLPCACKASSSLESRPAHAPSLFSPVYLPSPSCASTPSFNAQRSRAVSASYTPGRRIASSVRKTKSDRIISRGRVRGGATGQSTREAQTDQSEAEGEGVAAAAEAEASKDSDSADNQISKEVAKAVKKTASTFAPRSSTKSRNPATPGSTLYKTFEVQAYASMAIGGLLSFNLIFPSSEPDIWRLMGMWSVWMFTIPSLRARDCTEKEKTALNYLFLAVPLINVTLPLVWKSFAAVWTADVIAFFAFYAWKMDWLSSEERE